MKVNVGSSTYDVRYFDDAKQVGIPYFFTLGAVTIAGMLYLKDPVEDSFTDGAFAGVVVGTYRIDKNNTEACSDNGLFKICVKIDFPGKTLSGRICTRKLFGGGWDCPGWTKILSW